MFSVFPDVGRIDSDDAGLTECPQGQRGAGVVARRDVRGRNPGVGLRCILQQSTAVPPALATAHGLTLVPDAAGRASRSGLRRYYTTLRVRSNALPND
jgi:hypothetical protein